MYISSQTNDAKIEGQAPGRFHYIPFQSFAGINGRQPRTSYRHFIAREPLTFFQNRVGELGLAAVLEG